MSLKHWIQSECQIKSIFIRCSHLKNIFCCKGTFLTLKRIYPMQGICHCPTSMYRMFRLLIGFVF